MASELRFRALLSDGTLDVHFERRQWLIPRGHNMLICRHSQAPDDFSKKLKESARGITVLDFNGGIVWKDGQSRCFVELKLKNETNGVKQADRKKADDDEDIA